MNANRLSTGVLLVVVMATCATIPAHGSADAGPARTAAPADKGTRTMNAGRWEGDYIDIEGHRARIELTITRGGAALAGSFVLALATEDRPERYEGSLTGTLEGSTIVLRLQSRSGAEIGRRLTLAHPLSYAEQAVYGVVDPTPALKLGGGVLAAWKFKQ